MAKRVSAAGPKKAAAKKGKGKGAKSTALSKPTKAVSTEKIGLGHNLSVIRRELQPFLGRFTSAYKAMETDAGKHMNTIGLIYDEAKDVLGIPRKLIVRAVGEWQREEKRKAKDAKMIAEEREALDMMRAAMMPDLFDAAGVDAPKKPKAAKAEKSSAEKPSKPSAEPEAVSSEANGSEAPASVH